MIGHVLDRSVRIEESANRDQFAGNVIEDMGNEFGQRLLGFSIDSGSLIWQNGENVVVDLTILELLH